MINFVKDTRGMALVICLLIMTVAAMMGIGIATDSTIDTQISRNQRDITKDFFIADGTNRIKLAEMIEPDTPLKPDQFFLPEIVLNDTSDQSIPNPDNLSTPPKFQAHIDYLFIRYTNADGGNSIEAGGATVRYYYFTTQTNTRRNNHNKTGVKTTEIIHGSGGAQVDS